MTRRTRVSLPPRRVPATGAVLYLLPGQAKYMDWSVRLRVARPRPEISYWYDGDWCWVDAELLDERGRMLDVRPVLVNVDAVPDHLMLEEIAPTSVPEPPRFDGIGPAGRSGRSECQDRSQGPRSTSLEPGR